MLIPTIELVRELADAMDLNDPTGSAKGPLAGAKIALYTALAKQPGPGSEWADLTEATYTGYVQQDTVWSGPFDTAGGAALVSSGTTWTPTDSASPQSILGYALVRTGTPPLLLALENFDSPIPLEGPIDGFVLTIQAGMLRLSNLGTAAVVS